MSRHQHKAAAAERDQRRRDVQAKVAAAAGVDASDPCCEALSWLLLSLDVAKERLLAGAVADVSAWQLLVDQMRALMPQPADHLVLRLIEGGFCRRCRCDLDDAELAATQAAAAQAQAETATEPQVAPAVDPQIEPEAAPALEKRKAVPPLQTATVVGLFSGSQPTPFDVPFVSRFDNHG